MNQFEERERKYCLSSVNKANAWDRELLIYQFCLEGSKEGSTQIKIVFDFLRYRMTYSKAIKHRQELGISETKVEYYDPATIDIYKLVGCPFLLKRRSIKGNVCLDKYIVSNGKCDYILEVKDGIGCSTEEYIVKKEVTNDLAYYNQNMCIPFEEKGVQTFNFLKRIMIV